MGIETLELTESQTKSIQESTKKLYYLSRKKYTGKVIIDSDKGIMKAVEYKIRDEIKVN